MTEYRQLPGRDVWHFHPRCQHWPYLTADDYSRRKFDQNGVKVRHKKPTTGELCNECQAKTRKDLRAVLSGRTE